MSDTSVTDPVELEAIRRAAMELARRHGVLPQVWDAMVGKHRAIIESEQANGKEMELPC